MDAVKLAEEGEEIVVRVYEGHNQRGKVTLTFPSEVEAAWECDLLEEPEEELMPEGHGLAFFIRPYQLRTFRIRLTL